MWLIMMICICLLLLVIMVYSEVNDKRVMLTYIQDAYITDDNGVRRLRHVALVEYEYALFWLDLLNSKDGMRFHYGFRFDMSHHRSHSDESLNKYILDKVAFAKPNERTDFFIGPESSDSIMGILGVNQILQTNVITYGATTSKLDKTAKQEFIVRTMPSDTYRTATLIKLIDYYGWNYLTILSSDRTEQLESKKFTEALKSRPGRHVCIGSYEIFHPDKDICQSISFLNRVERNKVVIMFTTTKHSRRVLKCLSEQKLQGRFVLVLYYGSNNDPDVYYGNEEILDGAIGLSNDKLEIDSSFERDFVKLNPRRNPNHPFLKLYWELAFECNSHHLEGLNPNSYPSNCTFNETLDVDYDLFNTPKLQSIMMAFMSASSFVHGILSNICSNFIIDGICEFPNAYAMNLEMVRYAKSYLRKDNYFTNVRPRIPFIKYLIYNSKFDKETEEFEFINVGHHEIEIRDTTKYPEEILNSNSTKRFDIFKSIWWGAKFEFEPPTGKCSETCRPGYIKSQNSFSECCWDCIACKSNDVVNNNTCTACNNLNRADTLRTTCIPMLGQELKSSSYKASVYTLWGLLLFGCVSVIVVMVFVIWNRNTSLIGASGFPLWFFILMGALLSFLATFAFSWPASEIVCYFQLYIPTLGLALCHLALCAKAFRISHTFVGVTKLSSFYNLLGNNPYEKMTVIGMLFQFLILCAVTVTSKLTVRGKLSESGDFVTHHCTTVVHPLLFLLYIIVVLVCTYEAYRVRNFPHNHSETRDIAVTSGLSVILMLILVTGYLSNSAEPYKDELLMCWFYLLNGMIMLFGLFARKMWLLLHRVVGSGENEDSNSPRFRTFSANVGKTTNIIDIQTLPDSHTKSPTAPPMPESLNNQPCSCVFTGDMTLQDSPSHKALILNSPQVIIGSQAV